jgi:hydrogenase/urease accessory protein HupE
LKSRILKLLIQDLTPRFFVLLLLISSNSYAHLISAGYAAINIQSDKTSLLIGIPVSVVKDVDLNGDGMLDPDELKTGRTKILQQLQTLVQLDVGGNSGTVLDDLLMTSPSLDKKDRINQFEWLRVLTFPAGVMNQVVTLGMAPELAASNFIVNVKRAEESETAVLASHQLKHQFLKGGWGTFFAFIDEGVLHILSGTDHVLFLLMLLSASVVFRRWLVVLTSFTLAHGVTYGLATFGLVVVTPNFIEPIIAFTIVLVAVIHLLHWRPALKLEAAGVFSLGLFHGLGFASAMSEVSKELRFPIQSVLGFNVGVENRASHDCLFALGISILDGKNSRNSNGERTTCSVDCMGFCAHWWLLVHYQSMVLNIDKGISYAGK